MGGGVPHWLKQEGRGGGGGGGGGGIGGKGVRVTFGKKEGSKEEG